MRPSPVKTLRRVIVGYTYALQPRLIVPVVLGAGQWLYNTQLSGQLGFEALSLADQCGLLAGFLTCKVWGASSLLCGVVLPSCVFLCVGTSWGGCEWVHACYLQHSMHNTNYNIACTIPTTTYHVNPQYTHTHTHRQYSGSKYMRKTNPSLTQRKYAVASVLPLWMWKMFPRTFGTC